MMKRLEGGKKTIQTLGGIIVRYVYEELDSGRLLIQYNKQMPEIKRTIINNTEFFTLPE